MHCAQASSQWQIWHIGDGVVPAKVWGPCYNKSSIRPGNAAAAAAAAAAVSPPDTGRQQQQQHQQYHKSLSKVNPGNAAYVAVSSSPNGPWNRAYANANIPINFTGAWTSALAGNPAPFLHPDGSVSLYFTATPCPPNVGALEPNCIAVASRKKRNPP